MKREQDFAIEAEFEGLLSRYMDAEVTPEESALIEARLDSDPAAQLMLERLLTARAAIQDSYRADLEQVNFGDFWAGVEARLPAPTEARATARSSPSRAGPSFWERLGSFLEGFGWRGVGAGVAVAAVALLAVQVSQLSNSGTQVAVKLPQPVEKPQPTPEAVQVAELNTRGVQVNSVSGGSNSTVMVIPSDEVTIIWVDEGAGSSAGGTSI